MKRHLRNIAFWFKRNAEAPPPTEKHRGRYKKHCLHYMRCQGWLIWPAGQVDEYGFRCGSRRVYIQFFDATTMSNLKILDWHSRRVKLVHPFFILTRDEPHPAFVSLVADRGLILCRYVEIGMMATTPEERSAELAQREVDKTEVVISVPTEY